MTNNKKLDGIQIWKQFEDLLIPKLRLSMSGALYSHLLRHCRFEGKLQLRFSIGWLARGVGIGAQAARGGVRRLAAKGALRLTEKANEDTPLKCACRRRCADCGREKHPSAGRGVCVARPIWRKPTFWSTERWGKRSTRAKKATVFIACAALHPRRGASITSFRSRAGDGMVIATWSRAARSAIR